MPEPTDFLLGYLAHQFFPQHRAYYAGVLITDVRGLPREFRHTEGIKPSRLQATLYGDSLEQCLGSEAMAPALFGALQIKPHVLLVDKQSLPLFGPFLSTHEPAALLAAYDDPDKAFSESLDPGGSLLDARALELKGDTKLKLFAYVSEDASRGVGFRALQAAQQRMNLLTPFNRIRTVLQEIYAVENRAQ